MTDKRLTVLLLLTLLAALAPLSAAPAGGGMPAVELLDSGVQCTPANDQPEAVLIDDRQRLQRFASRLRGTILSPSSPRLPAIDFERQRVLYISAGKRPTAGYSLTLDEPPFTLDGETAVLHLRLNTPPPDRMVAAVVTHPCILVQIPAQGYSAIEIRGLGQVLELPSR